MFNLLFLYFLHGCVSVVCDNVADGVNVVTKGGVTVSSLTVAPNSTSNPSILFIGDKYYSIGVDSIGNFAFNAQNTPMLVINNNQTISMHMESLSVKNIELDGDLVVLGVTQFRMVWREDFTSARGWGGSVEKIGTSVCSGIQMLGGFKLFGRGYVQKTFIELPVHKELRIKANFHFIDEWAPAKYVTSSLCSECTCSVTVITQVGESGYMKLDVVPNGPLEYVWTDRHFHKGDYGINICGAETGDDKFSVPIDVTITHTSDRFTVLFGSTLVGDSVQQSWAISGLEIYIR